MSTAARRRLMRDFKVCVTCVALSWQLVAINIITFPAMLVLSYLIYPAYNSISYANAIK